MIITEKMIIGAAERVAAPIWRKLNPRSYSTTPKGDYCSPKLPSAMLAPSLLEDIEKHPFDKPVALKLVQYDMPLIWLSEALAQAIRNTVPSSTYNLLDLKLPLPAMTILLPKGSIVSRDKEVRFISWARFEPTEIAGAFKDEPHLFLTSGCADGTIQSLSLSRKSAEITPSDLGAFTRCIDGPGMYRIDETGEKMDNDRNEQVVFYFLSTILLMTIRPELLTETRFINRVVHKASKEVREFWTPRVLGAEYRVERREPQGGTHQSPRLHWVRGFFREQPYGPRTKAEHRTTWIEPFLRGV